MLHRALWLLRADTDVREHSLTRVTSALVRQVSRPFSVCQQLLPTEWRKRSSRSERGLNRWGGVAGLTKHISGRVQRKACMTLARAVAS